MSKKPGYVNPQNRGRERNQIKDYRRQDERPVENTQEQRPGKTCPRCKGSGDCPSGLIACDRCDGEGLIYG